MCAIHIVFWYGLRSRRDGCCCRMHNWWWAACCRPCESDYKSLLYTNLSDVALSMCTRCGVECGEVLLRAVDLVCRWQHGACAWCEFTHRWSADVAGAHEQYLHAAPSKEGPWSIIDGWVNTGRQSRYEMERIGTHYNPESLLTIHLRHMAHANGRRWRLRAGVANEMIVGLLLVTEYSHWWNGVSSPSDNFWNTHTVDWRRNGKQEDRS